MDAGLCVGRRVALLREASGLTRVEVAEAVGRSTEWLRAAEAGRQRLDRYAMVDALADVLGVAPGELLGLPCGREDPVTGPLHRAVPGLRRALLRVGLPARATADPPTAALRATGPFSAGARPADIASTAPRSADPSPADVLPAGPDPADRPSADALRRRLSAAVRHRQEARWTDLALALPPLLDDLRAHTADAPAGAEPSRLLARALHETALLSKRLGALDLAALAAAEVRHLAEPAADPVLSASALWLQAEVDLCAGAVSEAAACLDAGLAATGAVLGRADPQAWAVWGTLHLVSAVLEGQRGRQAESSAHLAEAASALAHTDVPSSGPTGFGEGEWAVHTVHAALELGEDLGALARIEGMDLRVLPAERRARHGIDRARAAARAGNTVGAAGELLAADRVASQVVRTHPLVGELLRTVPSSRPVVDAAARLGVRL
ncbi:helix-turn-helix domain-containing protein [Kitasatospora sp. NPDC048365]|uniref:helix-turn-helix domain-containing protein n=1 Tax=Kitasatospora sp. NPDC048365 TaxID=3364050 RepID=UPI00371B6BA3